MLSSEGSEGDERSHSDDFQAIFTLLHPDFRKLQMIASASNRPVLHQPADLVPGLYCSLTSDQLLETKGPRRSRLSPDLSDPYYRKSW